MAVEQEILDQVNELIERSDGLSLGLSNIPYMNPQTTQWVIHAIADRLPHLTTLELWGNSIGDAGARAIADRLPHLTTLDLRDNEIGDAGTRAIADRLSHLTKLYLMHNPIGDAGTQAIADRLPNLTHLYLSKTSITTLDMFSSRILAGWPVRWHDSGSVQGIYVVLCPLDSPTEEIACRGPEAVLNYYREIEAQGSDQLYEAKVLILGEGGAGKTSLLRRLYQTELALPEEQETTRGIDIHRHDFPCSAGRDLRLNVWDFGGQQIYCATHQFFLTKNSLYILVDDTRTNDKSIHDDAFKFWLEVVQTLSDSSPLLIFQNEKGGRSKAIDEDGIRQHFPNYKAKFSGNLEDPTSVANLRSAIEYYVQQLPHIGQTVPKKWVTIRAAIEDATHEKPYITQQEYFEIYTDHLEFDRTKALHLSQYFHDLGVFLHFQKDRQLAKTVILQNEWATEAVFKVLDDEAIKTQFGRFDNRDCARLWADSKYADMHEELRGLMEKFELCYELSARGAWLAPQLLSVSKPQALAEWGAPSDLVLRYKYTFRPRGLVSRLMVRQHRYVKHLDNSWAHGAFFERDATQVLVEETAKGSEIEFRARGPEAKVLLGVLSQDLEALNASFAGLEGKVEKLVPCICAECRKTTSPEMYSYSYLVKRKQDGKLQIECRSSYHDVNVLEILDGIKPDQLPRWEEKSLAQRDEWNDEDERSVPQERTVQIFLASSAELREVRDQFDLYLQHQTDRLRKNGLYLEVIRWEYFLDAMSETRLQDEYNKKVRDCDIFVSLFRTKTGKYTREEFEQAHEAFQAKGAPKILTYFQKFTLSSDQINVDGLKSLNEFKERLAELGHFPTEFTDAEGLKLHFMGQLHELYGV